MRESFRRTADTNLRRDHLRNLLHDIDFLAECSSYVGRVSTIEPNESWSTVLEKRVGPFKFSAPLKIRVVDEAESENEPFYLSIHAAGQDKGLGTRLLVDAAVLLQSDSAPTVVLEGTYDVSGRIASLGASVVREQANAMIDDFWVTFSGALSG